MLDHLLSRDCDPSRYVSVTYDDQAATFLLWNLSGQCVGYLIYRPDGTKERCNDREKSKYYVRIGTENDDGRRDGRDRLAVWGLETYHRAKVLYITEGLFNAATIHACGHAAIAVLANDPKHLRSWLNTLPNKIIAVCDGDDASKKLAKYADEVIVCPPGTDANELGVEKMRKLL